MSTASVDLQLLLSFYLYYSIASYFLFSTLYSVHTENNQQNRSKNTLSLGLGGQHTSHVMRRTQNSPNFKKRKRKKKREKKKRTSPATILKNPPKQRSSWPGSSTFCLRDLQKTPLKNPGNYSGLSHALGSVTDTLHWPYAFFSFIFSFFRLCAPGPRRPPCCLPEAIHGRTGVQIACDSVSHNNNKHVYNAVSIHEKLL